MNLKSYIREVADFPIKGISYKDITTLIMDPEVFSYVIEELYLRYKNKNITKVIGIESRGFIFASALAIKLKSGFIPIRKPGKLPYLTMKQEYKLEYGTDTLEIHKDAVNKKDKVILIDDLIATGGTAIAAIKLLKKLDVSIIDCSFVIGLSYLDGLKKLSDYKIKSNCLVTY